MACYIHDCISLQTHYHPLYGMLCDDRINTITCENQTKAFLIEGFQTITEAIYFSDEIFLLIHQQVMHTTK